MSKSKKADEQIHTGVRFSQALLDRADKVAARMSQPGLRVTRAEVIRMATFKGLDSLEGEGRKRKA